MLEPRHRLLTGEHEHGVRHPPLEAFAVHELLEEQICRPAREAWSVMKDDTELAHASHFSTVSYGATLKTCCIHASQ